MFKYLSSRIETDSCMNSGNKYYLQGVSAVYICRHIIFHIKCICLLSSYCIRTVESINLRITFLNFIFLGNKPVEIGKPESWAARYFLSTRQCQECWEVCDARSYEMISNDLVQRLLCIFWAIPGNWIHWRQKWHQCQKKDIKPVIKLPK